jgi:acyl carrier protein
MDNLNTNIRRFIINKFPLARKRQIRDSDALLETGMLDSQGVLDVVSFIEQEYSINISDEDLVADNFQSIDRIATFVQSKAKA